MDRNAVIFAIGTLAASAILLMHDPVFAGGLAVSAVAFSALWLLSLALRNASIVDVFWGLGFVVIGIYYLSTLSNPPTARGWLVMALVSVWGLRLSIYIGLRNAGSGEDFRYRKWRHEAGSNFWWISYFKVFLLQAIVLWVVSSPVMLAQRGDAPSGWSVLDLVALTCWLVGFLFEVISDWQLARFKKDPANAGQVMRSGLWSLSRHPNYFGEALLWWGIGLLALPTGGSLSFFGPAMITFLLIKVSGVAMLDAALEERRAGYTDYIRSTPAFLPLGRMRRWWQRRATIGI
jgi:steroid 5-alpha reductase family enzyme